MTNIQYAKINMSLALRINIMSLIKVKSKVNVH